jgi:protein-L-isoaspartate(D-aspartate) O-methyltransferase
MGKNLGKGIMALITREEDGFSARFVTFVAIYSCASVRDPQIEPMLAKSLTSGSLMKLKSVRRDRHEPTETCAVHGPDFCLSTAPLSAGQRAA